MPETIPQIRPSFNRSLRLETRPELLSADTGALVQRELMDRRTGKQVTVPFSRGASSKPATISRNATPSSVPSSSARNWLLPLDHGIPFTSERNIVCTSEAYRHAIAAFLDLVPGQTRNRSIHYQVDEETVVF